MKIIGPSFCPPVLLILKAYKGSNPKQRNLQEWWRKPRGIVWPLSHLHRARTRGATNEAPPAKATSIKPWIRLLSQHSAAASCRPAILSCLPRIPASLSKGLSCIRPWCLGDRTILVHKLAESEGSEPWPCGAVLVNDLKPGRLRWFPWRWKSTRYCIPGRDMPWKDPEHHLTPAPNLSQVFGVEGRAHSDWNMGAILSSLSLRPPGLQDNVQKQHLWNVPAAGWEGLPQ